MTEQKQPENEQQKAEQLQTAYEAMDDTADFPLGQPAPACNLEGPCEACQ